MGINIIEGHIKEHLSVISDLDDAFQQKIIEISYVIINSLKSGGTIFWCGNGGSSSDSQHLAAELVGRFDRERIALKSISLSSDAAVMTCISNDYGYEKIFSRQIEALGRKGDVIIGITTSGNSNNVIQAMVQSHNQELVCIGLLGKGGGKIKNLCDYSLVVPSNTTARIQEVHIMVGHILCDLIERGLKLNF
jgi:D-sedoheptulose 7-phosphate isomerase